MVCVPAALFLALGEMPEAQAIEIATLYTAEIPLDPDADDPRNDAYAAALVEVLLRVSGPELVNNPEVIEELFPNPAAYVTQYRRTNSVSLSGQFCAIIACAPITTPVSTKQEPATSSPCGMVPLKES